MQHNMQYKDLAARIHDLREICELSAETLAEELSVSRETYLGYEQNGENIPINALYHLAGRFNVALDELLTGETPHLSSYCLVPAGKGASVDRYPGYAFQTLAKTYKHRVMEPLLVTVEPSDKPVDLVVHTGQEFNYCIEGQMEVLFGEKVLPLHPGDSIYFNPTVPHGQRAVGGTARFLTVITNG